MTDPARFDLHTAPSMPSDNNSPNIERWRSSFYFQLRPLDGVDNQYYQKYSHQGRSLTEKSICIQDGWFDMKLNEDGLLNRVNFHQMKKINSKLVHKKLSNKLLKLALACETDKVEHWMEEY